MGKIRKGKRIELKELKKLETEILDEVAKYCKKNKLKFYLSSGTLLGAIRHKGFIPWDDDIDIIMPREDYEKFIKNYNKDSGHPYIKTWSYKNNSTYFIPFAKVVDTRTTLREEYRNQIRDMGVFIDIFPLDNLPDEESEREKVKNRKLFWSKIYRFSCGTAKYMPPKSKLKLYIKYVISFFMPRTFPGAMIDRACQGYSDATKYVVELPTKSVKFMCYTREAFKSEIMVEFEGKKYPAPVGYDEYLKVNYGDYMKLPPKEQRVNKHSMDVYWKEK